jgi:hypothetical protein
MCESMKALILVRAGCDWKAQERADKAIERSDIHAFTLSRDLNLQHARSQFAPCTSFAADYDVH